MPRSIISPEVPETLFFPKVENLYARGGVPRFNQRLKDALAERAEEDKFVRAALLDEQNENRASMLDSMLSVVGGFDPRSEEFVPPGTRYGNNLPFAVLYLIPGFHEDMALLESDLGMLQLSGNAAIDIPILEANSLVQRAYAAYVPFRPNIIESYHDVEGSIDSFAGEAGISRWVVNQLKCEVAIIERVAESGDKYSYKSYKGRKRRPSDDTRLDFFSWNRRARFLDKIITDVQTELDYESEEIVAKYSPGDEK